MTYRAKYIEAGGFGLSTGGIGYVSLETLKNMEKSLKEAPVKIEHSGENVGKANILL